MDIQEAYKVMQKASGIKVGDKVKILRTFDDDELGCTVYAATCGGGKQAFVERAISSGKSFVVWQVNSHSIRVDLGRDLGGDWGFPFFVLEVVKPSVEITVKVNGKESKLSDISEETLLKIRKEN